jgi:glucan biosynthesis protein C
MNTSRVTEGLAHTKQERLYFLDWLRVLAVLCVFFFHTLHPFDFLADWNVKNADRSLVVSFIMAFLDTWGMPLFFVLAGAASWFALRSRPGRQFLHERSVRLLIPLFVGLLLLSPPSVYVEALTHGRFAGSFFQFLPWFFAHIPISWHAPWIGDYANHLWFLEFLWLITLIALPLFIFLRGAGGSRVLDTLAAWCAKPGGIFLFVVPLALIRMTLQPVFPAYADWADFVFYLAFFVYGFLLVSRPSFAEAMCRHQWIALMLGLLAFFSIIGAALAGPGVAWAFSPSYTAGSLLYQLVYSLNTWAWLVVILACGMRFLNRNSKVLGPANEAVLSFYVLHQPVIIVIAFYVVQWPLAILPKWLIIWTLALAMTLLLYELVIRRVNAIRWLFGMKPRQRTPRQDSNGREQEGHQAEVLGGKAEQPVPLRTWKEDPSVAMPGQSDERAFTG